MDTSSRSLRALLLAPCLALSVCPAQGPTWAAGSPRPAARSLHAMAWQADTGRALVFGGLTTAGGSLGDTYEFDGHGWIQHLPTNAPTPRYRHAMAWDPASRRVLLFGGLDSSGPRNDTWAWDGEQWTQLTMPSPPPAASWSAMVHRDLAPSNHLLLVTNSGGSMQTWQWTGSEWLLRNTGGLPARSGAAVAHYRGTSNTYLYGGGGLADMWRWDGTSWTTVTQTGSPGPLSVHSMVWATHLNRLVVVGGFAAGGYSTQTFFASLTTASQCSWTAQTNVDPAVGQFVPTPREGTAVVYHDRKWEAWLFGGSDSTGARNDLARLTLAASHWQRAPIEATQPPARHYADMAYDEAGERCVLFGGWNGTAALGDTWVRDRHGWQQYVPAIAASPRILPGLAYLPPLGVAMFGGASAFGGPYLGDTRVFTPAGWQPLASVQNPSARYGHAMALDSARGRIVLFGGYGGAYLGDTWELSAAGWTAVPTANGPLPRSSHAMAYDRRRNRLVLFSGQLANGFPILDTWEYDGATGTWYEPPVLTLPPARWNHHMAYDEARGVVVMTGGYLWNNTFANDVWEYNGVTWRQRTPTTALPRTREAAAFAYDRAQARFVLHGGYDGTGGGALLGDTWLYDAMTDVPVAAYPGASKLELTAYPSSGQTFGVQFANASGFGWVLVGFAPDPIGLPLSFELLCPAATVVGFGGVFADAPGNPATLQFGLPGGLVGHGFTCQGVALELPGFCLRLTDPLVVTIGP